MIEIRQINPDEWQLLRQVRLAAVTDSPHAFAESLEETVQMPDSLWQQRTCNGAEGKISFCAVALDESTPIGIAVGLTDAENASRTYLVSMWVAPPHRGTTVALSLLQEVITWATLLGAEVIIAGVKPGNNRAEAFYKKCGFEVYNGAKPQHTAISDCDRVLSKKLK
jgi:RimJ/RimL family protein N-acetyltransferase